MVFRFSATFWTIRSACRSSWRCDKIKFHTRDCIFLHSIFPSFQDIFRIPKKLRAFKSIGSPFDIQKNVKMRISREFRRKSRKYRFLHVGIGVLYPISCKSTGCHVSMPQCRQIMSKRTHVRNSKRAGCQPLRKRMFAIRNVLVASH